MQPGVKNRRMGVVGKAMVYPILGIDGHVEDSSLLYDRRTKFPLYARSGVTEAWLVDLDAGRLEIHRVDLPLTVRDLLG